MARLQYTIDSKLKKQAETILKAQGIPPRVATIMFYVEIVNRKGLPFMPSKVPNRITRETFEKTDRGEDLEGPFFTAEELFKNLEK